MAAKFFTGLPLDGPDPECVKGHGERALLRVGAGTAPKPSLDHSHRTRPAAVVADQPRRAARRPPAAGTGVQREPAGRLGPRDAPTGGDMSAAPARPADLSTPRSPAGRGRRRAGRAARLDRAARPAPAAVDRHRHRGRAVRAAGRRPARRRAWRRRALRLQRRARRVRRHAVDRAGGARTGRRRARPLGHRDVRPACCSCRRTAATPRRCARAVAAAAVRGPRRAAVRTRTGTATPHAGRAETSMQLALRPERGARRPAAAGRHPAAGRAAADAARRRGAGGQRRTACSATRPARPRPRRARRCSTSSPPGWSTLSSRSAAAAGAA